MVSQQTKINQTPRSKAKEKDPIEKLVFNDSQRFRSDADIVHGVQKLRRLILVHSLAKPDTKTECRLRCMAWKLFLSVSQVSSKEYVSYVALGRSYVYDKVRNDSFRTLATDKEFNNRVGEDRLIRMLNAFVWKSLDGVGTNRTRFTYVQGMNVLAAPFLYAMSEVEAFYAFSSFIERCCPLYVQPTLEGVHHGLKLLDWCLKTVDPKLYAHLRSKNLSAELYAFPSCTPPLSQVLYLWDYLLAFGVHLNILCVIAQLLIIRDEILTHPSPMKLLRNFPSLNASQVIALSVSLVRQLPEHLYDLLARHPWDPRVGAILSELEEGQSVVAI